MAESSNPKNTHVLIMAGGSGTRFWPRSRATKPKQLLALWDEKSLLQHTVDRFASVATHDHIWVVTTQALVEPSKSVLGPSYSKVKYIAEPAAKNTAACIYLGILEIQKTNPDALIYVMPADHYIGDEKAFHAGVKAAAEIALEYGGIVTLGIKPSAPETGYGYIESGEKKNGGAFTVKKFVEKPDLRTAVKYLESGAYLWNAGMFVFKASEGRLAFEKCMPSLCKTFEGKGIEQAYAAIRPEDAVSVDYGVMEHASAHGVPLHVLPLSCNWNDVGSFPALEEINCAVRGEVYTHDSASYVVQADKGIVALLGVNDLVVVRDGDIVLVAAKDRAQDVKKLLEKVKAQRPELA